MYDIAFEDNNHNKYMYTAYNATNIQEAKKAWQCYTADHFPNGCKILRIVKVLKDLK